MRLIEISKALTALDRNGICEAQQLGAAGNLTINGAYATDGVATLETQRIVGIYSAGNLSGITFTVYGTNSNGITISEAVTGPNNATVSTTQNFLTVTRVAASAAVGSDVEVGTTGVGATAPIVLDQYISPFNVALGAVVTGTVNFTVQYTNGNVFPSNTSDLNNLVWIDTISAGSVNAVGTLVSPVAAVRLQINSGQGTVNMTVRQAGARG